MVYYLLNTHEVKGSFPITTEIHKRGILNRVCALTILWWIFTIGGSLFKPPSQLLRNEPPPYIAEWKLFVIHEHRDSQQGPVWEMFPRLDNCLGTPRKPLSLWHAYQVCFLAWTNLGQKVGVAHVLGTSGGAEVWPTFVNPYQPYVCFTGPIVRCLCYNFWFP